MAKDPRFNFYTDNWIGGTEGFTLEQEGAYLALIIMQTKVGPFTEDQAIDKLLQKTRGNTAVCTALWKFLLPKFKTDGILFWSERLAREVAKSKKHSEKQTERINKRWNKHNGNTAVLPVNSTGSGNGIGDDKKGVQGETEPDGPLPLSEKWFDAILDEIELGNLRMTFRDKDVDQEIKTFKAKARAAPETYQHRDKAGILLALHSQLRKANPKNKNGTHRHTTAIIERGKQPGKF